METDVMLTHERGARSGASAIASSAPSGSTNSRRRSQRAALQPVAANVGDDEVLEAVVQIACPDVHIDRAKFVDVESRCGRRSMPEIARFFGIIIRMFAEPTAPHHRPHLHAFYQDDVGIVAIDTVELIGGELPRRQRRLVEAWTEIHQAELLAAWDRLQEGRVPGKIEPLR